MICHIKKSRLSCKPLVSIFRIKAMSRKTVEFSQTYSLIDLKNQFFKLHSTANHYFYLFCKKRASSKWKKEENDRKKIERDRFSGIFFACNARERS